MMLVHNLGSVMKEDELGAFKGILYGCLWGILAWLVLWWIYTMVTTA